MAVYNSSERHYLRHQSPSRNVAVSSGSDKRGNAAVEMIHILSLILVDRVNVKQASFLVCRRLFLRGFQDGLDHVGLHADKFN